MDADTTVSEDVPTPALDQLIEQTKIRFWDKLLAGAFGVAPTTDPAARTGTGVLDALRDVATEAVATYSEADVMAVLADLWSSQGNYPLGAEEPELNRVLEVSSPHNVLFDLIVHIVLVRLTLRPPTVDTPDEPEEPGEPRPTAVSA
jgi:hypothetical protein